MVVNGVAIKNEKTPPRPYRTNDRSKFVENEVINARPVADETLHRNPLVEHTCTLVKRQLVLDRLIVS